MKLTLGPRDLSYVNEAGARLVAAGDYLLTVGGGQPGIAATHADVHLSIQGDQRCRSKMKTGTLVPHPT